MLPLLLVMMTASWSGFSRYAMGAETAAPPDQVYLFTSFRGNGEQGLRLASSLDGVRWTNVPGTFLKPWVGDGRLMRDPSLVRGPDKRFHLVWTTAWKGDQGFGHASSMDLVHWSPQQFVPVMQHEPTTVNVWAPELFYDDKTQQYVICWASTIPGRFPDKLEEATNNHRMYYTTTKDFVNFAPTRLFLEPGFSVIDCTIVERAHDYVLVLKDNTRPERKLRVAFGPTALGPWKQISEPFTAHLTEGPTTLKLGEDWLIYFDAYGEATYGAVKTRDFMSFQDVSAEVSLPAGHKHGTIATITRDEMAYLLRVGSEQISDVRLAVAPALPADELTARLAAIDQVSRQGPFHPTWESLGDFQTPLWYRDAKLGLFIHWGPYCVPAFGSEWYPRNMYRTGSPEFAHHLEKYGPHARFGYKDFIPQFRAEHFDPQQWARLFRESGARYVISVAEHHDGFAMYDSDYTEWSAVQRGPRRDILGELAVALKDEGLVLGASSHRAEHWWYFDPGLVIDSDVRGARHSSLYGPAVNKRVAESQSEPPDEQFLQDWLLRSCEIVDKYQPQVMYFDWWICQPVFQPYLQKFAAYYYNRGAEWGQQVAINFKQWEGESFPEGTGILDIERGMASQIRPDFWQTCTSVSKTSWGYVSNHQYKDIDHIIDDLVDVVSKNGTLLLNVGPRADGTFPEPEAKMLRTLGAWLKVHGEAIYGTRPWIRFGEGPTQSAGGSFSDTSRQPFTSGDIRFTTREDALYAIALAWPKDDTLRVKSLRPYANQITKVHLLGHAPELSWSVVDDAVVVQLPSLRPSEYALALKIIGIPPPPHDTSTAQ
jgi:alpha-L-fucosidase